MIPSDPFDDGRASSSGRVASELVDSLSEHDKATLNDKRMVNDAIVEFDIKYNFALKSEVTRKMVTIFDPPFFRKLINCQKRMEDFAVLKHTDIFERDFVLMPVCHSMHWILLIVWNPSGVFGYGECQILTFNSLSEMAGVDAIAFELVKKLFLAEGEKRGIKVMESRVRPVQIKCPQQPNGTDCGLFVGQFADFFLDDLLTTVRLAIAGKLGGWFDPRVACERRHKLRALLKSLGK